MREFWLCLSWMGGDHCVEKFGMESECLVGCFVWAMRMEFLTVI